MAVDQVAQVAGPVGDVHLGLLQPVRARGWAGRAAG